MANEKRLIYADALIEQLWAHNAMEPGLIAEIEHCPTADAVEVARCRDCYFCHYNSSNDTYKCSSMNGMYRRVQPDDFCSYGERRLDVN